jgi:hypothetical protein
MRRPTEEEEAPRCSLVKTLTRTCTGDEDRALVRSDLSSRETSGDLYKESIPASKDDFASFLSQNLDASVGKPISYQKSYTNSSLDLLGRSTTGAQQGLSASESDGEPPPLRPQTPALNPTQRTANHQSQAAPNQAVSVPG